MTPQSQVCVTGAHHAREGGRAAATARLDERCAGPGAARQRALPLRRVRRRALRAVADRRRPDARRHTASTAGRGRSAPALAFAAEIDGEPTTFFATMAARAAPGIARALRRAATASPPRRRSGRVAARAPRSGRGRLRELGRGARCGRCGKRRRFTTRCSGTCSAERPTLERPPASRARQVCATSFGPTSPPAA